jgi:hypothetical protein
MAWQLWVLIAAVAAGLAVLGVTRMLHARRVFDDIVRLDQSDPATAADANRSARSIVRPPAVGTGDVYQAGGFVRGSVSGRPPGLAGLTTLPADDLARARARRLAIDGGVREQPTHGSPHRKHG